MINEHIVICQWLYLHAFASAVCFYHLDFFGGHIHPIVDDKQNVNLSGRYVNRHKARCMHRGNTHKKKTTTRIQ